MSRGPNHPRFTCPSCRQWAPARVVPTERPRLRAETTTEGVELYRRLLECLACGAWFTTTEQVEGLAKRRKAKDRAA